MGITGAGTVLMLVLAYIAQSPLLLKRLGLAATRLDLRARALTGYALALLLLAFGFFLAGVPLDTPVVETASTPAALVEDTDESGAMLAQAVTSVVEAPQETPTPAEAGNGSGRPASGAFSGPPPAALTSTAESVVAAAISATPEEAPEETAAPQETATPSPTSTTTATPDPTATATPTSSPTPTLTPTPIFASTATVNVGSSTVWLKRTPGGQDDVLIRGGDTVILLAGHANRGGTLWRQVSSVDGQIGWVLESYLTFDEDESEAGS